MENFIPGPYHREQYNSLVKRMKSETSSKDPFQVFVSIINDQIIWEDEFVSIKIGLLLIFFEFFQF